MEQLGNEIRLTSGDKAVDSILKNLPDHPGKPYSMRFNHNEEFFLRFDEPFEVPSFPVHHDVNVPVAETAYSAPFIAFAKTVTGLLPDAFRDLSYFFDPGDISKPGFHHFYKIGDSLYAYIMRLDLAFRASECEPLSRGTNDSTPAYRTRNLYLESEIIPLESVMQAKGKITGFTIRQTISETWIGETGRGYLVRGIWIDSDLSKFFSKLVLPPGKRSYPFWPLTCKYSTICASLPIFDPERRKEALPWLHRIIQFMVPEMKAIQESLKNGEFSENNPIFTRMKEKINGAWTERFNGLDIQSFLNEREMKEFILEF